MAEMGSIKRLGVVGITEWGVEKVKEMLCIPIQKVYCVPKTRGRPINVNLSAFYLNLSKIQAFHDQAGELGEGE